MRDKLLQMGKALLFTLPLLENIHLLQKNYRYSSLYLLFLSPARGQRSSFYNLRFENLVGFLEAKLRKCGAPLKLAALGVSGSPVSSHSAPPVHQTMTLLSLHFMALIASAPSKQLSSATPCPPSSQNFQMQTCPATSLLWLAQEKLLIFTVFSIIFLSFFFLIRKELQFQALYMLELKLEFSSCLNFDIISNSYHFHMLVKLINCYHYYLHHEYSNVIHMY